MLFDVWLIARLTYGALDDVLEPSGLSADEFGIYSVLHAPAPITPTELAKWMCAPSTTVSSYVKRLEKARPRHTSKEPRPTGRSYVLELTDEGQRAHHAASGAVSSQSSSGWSRSSAPTNPSSDAHSPPSTVPSAQPSVKIRAIDD